MNKFSQSDICVDNSVFYEVLKNTSAWIIEIYNLSMENIVDYFDFKIIERFSRKNKLRSVWGYSQEMQDTLDIISWIEETERLFFRKEWEKLLISLRKARLLCVVKSIYFILYLFLTKRGCHKRIVDIWRNIKYEWVESDALYLQHMIKIVKNPERKSKLAYLLWKIKDKRIKRKFERIGKLPTQIDLLLQQCKKWQIMLTNGLNLDWSSSTFKDLTQTVSWCRWCHCLIISDVIKDERWIVRDLNIIHSTLNSWVHETSFRKYICDNYSKSDFLLASFPRRKIDSIILNMRNHIWQKYDRISMMLDILAWWDTDSVKKNQNIDKTYCTGLIFDAMQKSSCNIPKIHLTPSDLLLSEELTLEYACYCDNLWLF